MESINLYQFDDAELLKIDTSTKERGQDTVYLTFHGARMYSDAARLKVYEKSGTFPKVTKAVGLVSLKSVVAGNTASSSRGAVVSLKQSSNEYMGFTRIDNCFST